MRPLKLLTVLLATFLSSQSFTATYEALVTNYDSGTVSFVSLPGGVVTDTIPVGSNPYGIATTPNMRKAYVVNYGSETVAVIDVATHSVMTAISVGSNPYFIAITPDGKKAYVPNYGTTNVSVIDTATNTVVATVGVGAGPYGIVITPSGQKAYVINYDDATVSVINVATDTVIATIPVGNSPYLPTVTPNSAYVYVPNYDDGTVSVIRTASDTVIETFSLEGGYAQTVFITPDGKKGYIPAYYNDFIFVFDPITNTPLGNITVGSGPLGVAFTADSSIAYVGNYSDSSVSIVNAISDTVITTIPGITTPFELLLTPDTTQVALTSYASPGHLDLITVPTNVVAYSTTVGDGPSYIAFGLLSSHVLPPSNLTGKQRQTKFISQIDVNNVISWTAPTSGATPVAYRIYRDNLDTLIGVVRALSFTDHNLRKKVIHTYYVVSEDSEGALSTPVSITVHP